MILFKIFWTVLFLVVIFWAQMENIEAIRGLWRYNKLIYPKEFIINEVVVVVCLFIIGEIWFNLI